MTDPGSETGGSPRSVGYPRGTLILIGLAAAVVIAFGIGGLRDILAPVLLTLILTICAYPVGAFLKRHGVPGGIATIAIILVVLVLLGAFAYTLIVAFGQFVTLLPNYAEQLAAIGANLGAWLQSLGIGPEQVQAVRESFDPTNILSFFTGLLGSVFGITGGLVIVFTMLILMAADAIYLPTVLNQMSGRRPHLVAALHDYASGVRRYMVVTTVLGIAQGALNTVALAIMGVPAALLWGILSFLCSFIPNIGYFFAIIPPLVFGYFVGGWPIVIAIIIVYGIINAVVQSIIQPKVVGKAVSLSQTLTFFSVLFWAVVLGPIGAILAIPLTLFWRTLLVDANPESHWMRPVIGDTHETKDLMRAEDATAKEQRAQARATKRANRKSPPPGS